MVRIESARIPADVHVIRGLFREYADWLGEDLCFQGFEKELETLPGKYARPHGDILLAWKDRAARIGGNVREESEEGADGAVILGCAAYRPFEKRVCEMKRLWVRPDARHVGLGRALVMEIERRAAADGYSAIVLDTLGRMVPALRLYLSLGYLSIPAYYHNPIPGAVYLSKTLSPDVRVDPNR
jgi:ribosomal protein S18 acetylase RimI-like enzyme